MREKTLHGEKLTEQELMEFIILPLSVTGNENKQRVTEEMLDLSDKVDDSQRRFLLSGIALAGDKFLTDESREKIRRRLAMTKVGMMFEKEKEEALKEQAKQMKKQMKEELRKKDKQIEKKDQQIEKKDKQIEKKDQRIKVLLAEIERLGGNAAVL